MKTRPEIQGLCAAAATSSNVFQFPRINGGTLHIKCILFVGLLPLPFLLRVVVFVAQLYLGASWVQVLTYSSNDLHISSPKGSCWSVCGSLQHRCPHRHFNNNH
jgi:hypothetical protein